MKNLPSRNEAAQLFVEMLISDCLSPIVQDVMGILAEGPPGGGPHPEEDGWHEWFQGLSATEQSYVKGIIGYSVGLSLFSLLNVLDGSGGRPPLEQTSNFAVYLQTYENDDDEEQNNASGSVHINSPYPWPEGEHLHDIFTELVQ